MPRGEWPYDAVRDDEDGVLRCLSPWHRYKCRQLVRQALCLAPTALLRTTSFLYCLSLLHSKVLIGRQTVTYFWLKIYIFTVVNYTFHNLYNNLYIYMYKSTMMIRRFYKSLGIWNVSLVVNFPAKLIMWHFNHWNDDSKNKLLTFSSALS
jgi:hypothetical protein